MPAFSARYPVVVSSSLRTPGPPGVISSSSAGGPFPVGQPGGFGRPPVTPVISTFGVTASGTPLVNNFGAPSPATAFGTPSILGGPTSAAAVPPRPLFSGAAVSTSVGGPVGQPPQPYQANGPYGTPAAGPGLPTGMPVPRPSGVIRPRYPTAPQYSQQQPPGPSPLPPTPQASMGGPRPALSQQQPMPPMNGMPTTVNGPAPDQFYPSDRQPGVGGLPPPPLQNGQMPPPSQNGPMIPPQPGMPPMPPTNGPLGPGQGRFGGDVQSLGASLGGLSVTQSGKLRFSFSQKSSIRLKIRLFSLLLRPK